MIHAVNRPLLAPPSRRVAAPILVLMGVLLAATAHAVDGVIEINQAVADAGGINGNLLNDPPGFPVTIWNPGSYVLTGNLALPDENTTAIQVMQGPFTLDMNGFSITGPARCITIPPVCNVTGTGIGIDAERDQSTIRNGSVTGTGSHGILVLDDAIVEGVHVRSVGGEGIRSRNQLIARGNNVSLVNSHALSCNTNCLILENTLFANGGFGISASIDGSYGHNLLDKNNGGAGNPQVSSGLVEFATNVCDGNTTCP